MNQTTPIIRAFAVLGGKAEGTAAFEQHLREGYYAWFPIGAEDDDETDRHIVFNIAPEEAQRLARRHRRQLLAHSDDLPCEDQDWSRGITPEVMERWCDYVEQVVRRRTRDEAELAFRIGECLLTPSGFCRYANRGMLHGRKFWWNAKAPAGDESV